MPLILDLPWQAAAVGDGPASCWSPSSTCAGSATSPRSCATRWPSGGRSCAPGARSLYLRARPLARHFTTVSWWDDEAAVRAFVRTDPHRSAMRRWGPRLREFSNRSFRGTVGVVPTVAAAEAASA